MAGTARRVDSRSEKRLQGYEGARADKRQGRQQAYEEGNAVRQVETVPDEVASALSEETDSVTASRRVRENRARFTHVGAGYVCFLALICVFTMGLCVRYLQMKAELTTQNETIAAKETQLNKLKADNDAYYDRVLASVTLEDVKAAALDRLGMHYATESQIQYYSAADNSYVRQYQDLSDSE